MKFQNVFFKNLFKMILYDFQKSVIICVNTHYSLFIFTLPKCFFLSFLSLFVQRKKQRKGAER